MPDRHHFRTSRWVILIFGLLGAALLALAMVFAVVAKDTLWALACVSVPAGGMGLWLLTRVPRLLRTRVVVDDFGTAIPGEKNNIKKQ